MQKYKAATLKKKKQNQTKILRRKKIKQKRLKDINR